MSEDIDVGQISETLNDKMDRDSGNISNTGKDLIVGLGMPDYSRGVEYTSNTTGTLQYDSMVICTTSSNSNCQSRFLVNGSDNTPINDLRCYGTSGGIAISTSSYFPKGSNYEIIITNGTAGKVRVLVYPLKGSL